jgi:hypothetical protein
MTIVMEIVTKQLTKEKIHAVATTITMLRLMPMIMITHMR